MDALQQSCLLEHAAPLDGLFKLPEMLRLLLDAWTSDASNEEVQILQLWARGEKEQAMQKARRAETLRRSA